MLLWLAGGPGGSQLATVRYHLGGLEDHFVVVNWEQPGAGKSYGTVQHSQLTVDRYVSDAYALVQHLKSRFGSREGLPGRRVVGIGVRHLAGAETS